MQQWSDGFRVFVFGFGGVFVGLVLLMLAIQLNAFLLNLFSKRSKKN